jgi:hypothetical protein
MPGTAREHVPYIPEIDFSSGRNRPVRLSRQFKAIALGDDDPGIR